MKKLKTIIVVWFIFSWLFLIAVTLKPTGTLNTLTRAATFIKESIYPSPSFILGDFSSPSALEEWAAVGILAETTKGRLKVTLLKSFEGTAKLSLENYNLGAGGNKDWKNFSFLKFLFFNPQSVPILFHVKIKDMSGRYVEIACSINPGKDLLSIDLNEFRETVDLANIVHLSMYYPSSVEERVFFLDKVWLAREGKTSREGSDIALLDLVSASLPAIAKRGTTIEVSLQFSLLSKVRSDYSIFIHFSHSKDAGLKPAQRRYYINLDQSPGLPTSQWETGKPYQVGPVSFYIPKDFPPRIYVLQAGFFNPASHGSYGKGSSGGMVDFSGSYPRLRYRYPVLKNYIIGKIKVLE